MGFQRDSKRSTVCSRAKTGETLECRSSDAVVGVGEGGLLASAGSPQYSWCSTRHFLKMSMTTPQGSRTMQTCRAPGRGFCSKRLYSCDVAEVVDDLSEGPQRLYLLRRRGSATG